MQESWIWKLILIYSLDAMKISADMVKQIRATYKGSAASISQSTKAGDLRGSYEIVDDLDIAVAVETGSDNNQNRFRKGGTTFNVFEEIDSLTTGMINYYLLIIVEPFPHKSG